MDEDRDAESVEFSALSSSWWMMHSLWQPGAPDDRRLRTGIVDTVLLQDGHLMCWYFSSSRTGRVGKRNNKRCDWDELMPFLIRRAKGISGSGKDQWTPGVIATARRLRVDQTSVVMLTEPDLTSLRQKHNVHLLDEIVAIQPYVPRKPFSGCGLFETTFVRKGRFRESPTAFMTHELAQWSEEGPSPNPVPETDNSDGLPPGNSPGCRFERGKFDGKMSSARAGGRSAQRVHGVLHRVLAATTKDIVNHVERETGELLLAVVAHFVFRPGSGKPTLLWLDKVTTLRSIVGDRERDEAGGMGNGTKALVQQTPAWWEVDMGWTTFFPAKMDELGSVVGSAGSGLKLSGDDMLALVCSSHNNSETTAGRGKKIPVKPVPNANSMSGQVFLVETTANTSEQEILPHDVSSMPETVEMPVTVDCILRSGASGHDADVVDSVNDVDGGHEPCGHFALPTESWAYRSAGLRGLYSTRGAGTGRGAMASRGRWPRKRSTGTTMRVDKGRPDLRLSSEAPRPSTAPARLTEAMKHGMRGTKCLPRDAVSCRLSSRSNGCFGDFCRYALTRPSRPAKYGSDHRQDLVGPSIPKRVPYKSILKCRAEERALASMVGQNLSSGQAGPENLQFPVVRGDEKDPDAAFQKVQEELRCAVSTRMRLLTTYLKEDGLSEYSMLRSADRRRAGSPEAARRAVEELLYEETLRGLHPTTMCRSVAVCDSCAMVYGFMDLYRSKGRRLKMLLQEKDREAQAAWRREHLARGHKSHRSRPSTCPNPGSVTPTLRRYSALNLTGAATSEGLAVKRTSQRSTTSPPEEDV